MSELKTDSKTETKQGVIRWTMQMIVSLVIYGALLFVAAGRLDWRAGWVFLGLNALTQVISAIVLIPRQAGMLAERTRVREGTKDWDRILTPVILMIGTLVIIVIAGLDSRLGWSGPLKSGVWILSLVIAFCCQMFVLWAMASNPFFATTVRIQDDRGHNVVSSGPYRLVRHPGYLGSVIYNLVSPLVLGSFWAFLPVLLTIILLMVRTRLEDQTLKDELPGYREYAAGVRHRLIPGVW